MKRIEKRCCIYAMWVSILFFNACKKNVESQLIIPFKPTQLTKRPLLGTLLKTGPFTLFYQMAVRTGGIYVLTNQNSVSKYTVFAPTNEALVHEGLDSIGISTFPLDSLRKIVYYHIVNGLYSDSSLAQRSSNITCLTLRIDTISPLSAGYILTQPYFLYLAKYGFLTINGQYVNKGDKAVEADNGFLYGIDSVLRIKEITLRSQMKKMTELSYFVAALKIADSLDNKLFIPLFGLTPVFDYSSLDNPGANTVFAPTNQAFIDAGLPTVDSIRKYAVAKNKAILKLSRKLGSYFPVYFNNIDSVLSQHVVSLFSVLGNGSYHNRPYTDLFFTNDIIHDPSINGGRFANIVFGSSPDPYFAGFPNKQDKNGDNYQTSQVDFLMFYIPNAPDIQVTWSPNFGAATIDPIKRDILTTGGVIHEVDKLFVIHPQPSGGI